MLSGLRKLFIDSYIWVSLGAALLSWMSRSIAGQSFSFPNIIFAFGGTLAVYNFHRWYKVEGNQWKNLKFFLSLAGSAFSLISLFYLERWEAVYFIAAAALLSVLYIVPFSVISGIFTEQPMRERRGLKLWLIALTWSLVTVIIPLSWGDVAPGIEVSLLLFIERLSYIAAITIPFDIRDIYLDDPRLQTIPQRFGAGKSLLLSILLLTVSMAMTLFLWDQSYLSTEAMGAILGTNIITMVLIARSKVQREKWYYAFVLDGLMVIHPLAYFIAQNY